jgi:hypothetical protein
MDFQQIPSYPQPKLPVGAVQSYQIVSPVVGVRRLTCEQAQCGGFVNGWQTRVAADSDIAAYIRQASGRRFTEDRDSVNMAIFTFPPGQMCFRASEHREFAHAADVFALRPGDWRGQTGDVRVFNGRHAADDWVDHFANHQDRVATIVGRG